MSASRFCPNCGRPVPLENRFCVACGFAMPPAGGMPPPGVPGALAAPTPAPAYSYPGIPPGVPPGYYPPVPPGYYPPVRRATFSEMFSGVFEVWTKHFLEFFVVYLVLSLVTGALGLLGAIVFLHVALPPGGFGGFSFTGVPSGVDLVAYVAWEFMVVVVGLVFSSIVLGGVTDLAVRARRGERVRLQDALSRGLHRFPSVLGANLLVTLVTVGVIFVPLILIVAVALGSASVASLGLLCGALLAFPLLGVLAIYIGLALLLYAPVIMVEGANALDSLGRSWNLTKGRKWSLFAAILVLGLISALLSGAITAIGVVSGNVVISTAATAIGTGVTGGWFAILAAVAYDLIVSEPKLMAVPPAYMPPAYMPPR